MTDQLFDQVEDVLEEGGFDFCEYRGCFDIAARKDSMILIKVLSNVDSFHEEQATSLRTISKHLDARSFLVGLHTRREKLSDKILYERFDVPTMSPRAFESVILNESFPSIYRLRGGLFVEINPISLREAREDAGLTQSELAGKVGVTKKNIYEHEKKGIRIEYESALKIEKVLKTTIIEPVKHETSTESVSMLPKSVFEGRISKKFKSMGFDTDSVYQSPFNMMAREKRLLILSGVEESSNQAKKKISGIKEFSEVSHKSAIIITKEEVSLDLPSITEKDFLAMNQKDMRKIVRTK